MQGSKVAPRGLMTMELRPGLLRMTNPKDALPTRIGRPNLSAAVGAAEALQLISGFSYPDLLFEIAPSFRNYTNDVGTFDGAYGPRITRMLEESVIPRLMADPDTRQAIATIYDESDALRPTSRDYPCTLSLHFLVRDGKLCLAVTMRSNDIWLGLPYDLFQFTQLQCTVANGLDLAVGDYTHLANSFHLYERNWKDAEKVEHRPQAPLSNEAFHTNHLTGIGRKGMPWSEITQRAEALLYGHPLPDPTMTEKWYARVLAPAHEALAARVG